jgi:hypothetical protein
MISKSITFCGVVCVFILSDESELTRSPFLIDDAREDRAVFRKGFVQRDLTSALGARALLYTVRQDLRTWNGEVDYFRDPGLCAVVHEDHC